MLTSRPSLEFTRKSRRVVITGLGVIAPNGIGRQAFWRGLLSGNSAVRPIGAFDPSPYPCKVAAEVRDFEASDFLPPRLYKGLGRFTQFAIASAVMAVEDAGIRPGVTKRGDRVGVCFGTAASGMGDIGERSYKTFMSRGAQRLSPFASLEFSAHAAASHIASILSVSGPSTSITSGCATGLDTVHWGASLIRSGQLDTAIVGASDAPLTEFIFSLFCAGEFLSTWQGPAESASRPYDLHRSGLVLGEGAGALVLEDLDSAQSRGARIYCEIGGVGAASEGGFTGRPRDIYQQGLEHAIADSLTNARLRRFEVDHIHSHGNSTRNDDAAETAAYKSLFGEHAYRLSITSIKGAIGQPLAAGGILQLASLALALFTQQIPPTINRDVPDPECDLDYVPRSSRIARIRCALAHSHSLGGVLPGTHTAVLVLAPQFS
jgi:3-oxoacyl-[acyl-carrier-protein] synthase II